MKGKFWIGDLEEKIERELQLEKGEFSSCIELPSRHWLLRKIFRTGDNNTIAYCGEVTVEFTGFYDGSGEDIWVTGNTFLPENIPLVGKIGDRIAREYGVNFSGEGFCGPDEPMNDVLGAGNYAREIRAASRELDRFADRLADTLYGLVERNK